MLIKSINILTYGYICRFFSPLLFVINGTSLEFCLNFIRGNINRKYYQSCLLYFSTFRLSASERHRCSATAERNSSNRFRETRWYPKFSDLMCLDFVTYYYCCTLWPLLSSLEAVTVVNFVKARLLLSFENRLCFELTFSLECIKHPWIASTCVLSYPLWKYLSIYDYDRAHAADYIPNLIPQSCFQYFIVTFFWIKMWSFSLNVLADL